VPEFSNLPEISMEYDKFHKEEESFTCDGGGIVFQSCSAFPEPFKQQENQEDLSDFIKVLNLSKEAAKFLHPNQKTNTAIGTGASITFYRTREKELLPYFRQQEKLICC